MKQDASIVALSKCARGHFATVMPACARIAVPCAVRVINVGCRSLPLRSQRHRPAALADSRRHRLPLPTPTPTLMPSSRCRRPHSEPRIPWAQGALVWCAPER